MSNDDQESGFEYKNKGIETPFETFLRYTDEKEKSSDLLATILNRIPKTSILDIGTGNGQYLKLILSKITDSADSKLTLLEPSSDLVKQLKASFDDPFVTIINSNINDFSTDDKFDIVLASHLFYHIPRFDWAIQLLKMLSLLKPEGKLILVLREKDDAHAFKMAFKPLLFNENFQALTIEDVLVSLPEDGLTTSRYTAESELHIPVNKNIQDTVSIVEFYLNKQWEEIPDAMQQDVLSFIKNKNGVLKQLDGIAIIQKQQ